MLGPVHMTPLDSSPFGRPSRNPSIKLRHISSEARSLLRRKGKEKGSILGFEVCRCLHWQYWELGKERTKNLTLKNVQLRKQKIKFSPPVSTFFKTLFPQTVTLNAGTSFSLPVTFRPLEKRDYEDAITFETEEGSFSVALRATLPRHELQLPEALSLPTCAVYDTSEATFVLCNVSDMQTRFRWDVPEPFSLIPASGVLDPRCEVRTKVVFQPKIALVYNAAAACHFGEQEEYQKMIQFNAIAKYPHLLVTVPEESCEEKEEGGPLLDFGSVGVSMVSEKIIEIHNLSMVDSPFRIEQEKRSSEMDRNFSCEVSQGVVPAHGKQRVPLQFRPRIVGMESVDYFHVIPAGNLTRTVLKVSGTCKGPSVSLQTSLVNFGLLHLGEKVLRTLEMTNNSEVPAVFQFHIDSTESVFSFNVSYGTLSSMETRRIEITFSPLHPIPHYRRVACLIHHQDPLFVDLIGTCHSDMEKAAIVLPKHLSTYRTNMRRGLSVLSPDILDAMLDSGKLSTDSSGALTLLEQDADDPSPETRVLTDAVSEFFDDEFNQEDANPISHITASTRDFDFSRCVCSSQEPRPLSLTNHTKGKVTVIWTCKPDSPFRITPERTEIPPLKSTAFRVIFHPSQINTLYAAELEGFVFYKVLRDYRNVKDVTICPPWCITLQARGHTFALGQEHFVPRCVLDSPRLVFPPAKQDIPTYRSLLLQNTGPTIMTFVMDGKSCPGLQAKPSSGHLDPGSHQILLVRTSPGEGGLVKHTVPLQLNYSSDYTQEIVLSSRAETPQLSLETEGKLYFKPTCVGSQSEGSYSLRNISRVPVHFEWRIQQEHLQYVSVHPRSGIIRPNEILAQKWSFVPQEERTYFVKATVLSWLADPSPEHSPKSRYILRITGEGCQGRLSTEQESVDLGNVLVGSFQSYDLLLSNGGDCTLEYTLSAKQELSGPCDPDDAISDPVALEFEHEKGRLPARTKLRIRVTARPARRASYTWTISYCILSPQALDPANTISEDQFLCTVTAQGVYPTFSVVDACPAGTAGALSKTQLWKLFSLERLNSCLQRDPTPGELIYRVPTRHSIRRCPSVNTPVLLDFNFGAAPVGSEPFVTLLLLENKGVLPVSWDFLFPVDQQIELEFWAETWEFDPSEIHQMRIQDNKLFTISPKSGNLNPGQQQTLQLTYRHDFVGTDRLPVLLKVSHGREILLNFIGVTVEKEQRYVHFTSTKHRFTPVAIGSSSPSKQTYELFNGGSVAVIYEIQLEPLREVQEQNYHHPVFQCLNPRGEILPGATAFVEWIFSPLEAKTYSVTIPVHILGGDSALITFEGIGYDRSVLGDTAVFEPFSPLSVVPRLTLPGQIPHLTQQKLAFGDIPVFSKSSRLLFLNNTSESESIFFTWYAASPNASEALQVCPLSGAVRPGESLSIAVTLQAGEQASFYILELVCEILLQKALAEYERNLREWEEEGERQSLEFTIPEERTRTASGALQSSGAQIIHAQQQLTDIRRYKTLPPIKNADYPRPAVSRDRESRRAMKEGQRVWPRPQPPVPLQLHLSVTGRSHHTPDFLNQFQNDFPRHFQQRPYKKKMEKPAPVDLQPETGEPDRYREKPSSEQQEMARDVMTSIIRNLLDDKQFHEALIQIQKEPLPYFSQLRSTQASPNTAAEQRAMAAEEEVSSGSEVVSGDVAHEETETKPVLVPEDEQKEMMKRNLLDDKQFHEALIQIQKEPLPYFSQLRSTQASPNTAAEQRAMAAEEEMSSDSEVVSGDVAYKETETKPVLVPENGQKEMIKRTPMFSQLVEAILENTLQNIMTEANRGEVVLTTRPRVIALPPATPRGNTPTSSARSVSRSHNVPATPRSPEAAGPVPPADVHQHTV